MNFNFQPGLGFLGGVGLGAGLARLVCGRESFQTKEQLRQNQGKRREAGDDVEDSASDFVSAAGAEEIQTEAQGFQVHVPLKEILKILSERNRLFRRLDAGVSVLQLCGEEVDLGAGVREWTLSNPECRRPHCPRSAGDKFVLLIGPRDTWKTEWSNGAFNYHLGVQFDDEYRFQVADEDRGGTNHITIYVLPLQPGLVEGCDYNLFIIDTPCWERNTDARISQRSQRSLFSVATILPGAARPVRDIQGLHHR